MDIKSNHCQVSVIICTHSRKGLVGRAIDSALCQEGCSLEIIVVDDCSYDGTFEYLKEYYDGHIKLLSTEANSGRAVASNLGFEHSTGNFIALLDDDDYWIDSCKLKKQLDIMWANPMLGVLGTWWIELKSNDVKEEMKPIPSRNRYLLIEKLLMGGGVVSGSSPLIARAAWERVGGMDVKHVKGIDSDLYRRIALSGYDVDVLKEVTTVADASHEYSRMTPVQSRRQIVRALSANTRVLKKYFFYYFKYPRALIVRIKSIAYLIYSLILFCCPKRSQN